jgi:hypothetical protein
MKHRVPILVLCWLALFASLAQASDGKAIKVHKGETLWQIAHRELGKGSLYPVLQKQRSEVGKNNPHRISIGEVLKISVADKAKANDSEVKVATPAKVEGASSTKAKASVSKARVKASSKKANGTVKAVAKAKASVSVAKNSAKKAEGRKTSAQKVSSEVSAEFEKALALFQNPEGIRDILRKYAPRRLWNRLMDYVHPSRNPYRGGTLETGLDMLAYPADVADALAAKVAKGRPTTVHISRGQIMLMTSGPAKTPSVALSRGAWIGEDEKMLAADEYSVEMHGYVWRLWSLFDCRNLARPPEMPIPVQSPPTKTPTSPPPTTPTRTIKKAHVKKGEETVVIYTGKKCYPEIEATVGAFAYVNMPKGDGDNSHGQGAYAEALYWKNCKSDCSSEYWWGVGAIGSLYSYAANNLPSEGDGWRLAGEVGLKRLYERDALNRSWQIKARLGEESSHWENPETGKSVDQTGPGYGFYAEYIRELQRNKLWWVTQGEGWFGFNQEIDGPAEWGLEPEARTRLEASTGLDYRFQSAPRWTLRGQLGWGYQGYDSENYVPWNLQLMYELPNKYGRLAFGVYGQHYLNIGDSVGGLVRYETGEAVRKFYSDKRAGEHHYTGKKGIAYGKTEASLKPVSHIEKRETLAVLFPQGND